jgi:hypothetical protein
MSPCMARIVWLVWNNLRWSNNSPLPVFPVLSLTSSRRISISLLPSPCRLIQRICALSIRCLHLRDEHSFLSKWSFFFLISSVCKNKKTWLDRTTSSSLTLRMSHRSEIFGFHISQVVLAGKARRPRQVKLTQPSKEKIVICPCPKTIENSHALL